MHSLKLTRKLINVDILNKQTNKKYDVGHKCASSSTVRFSQRRGELGGGGGRGYLLGVKKALLVPLRVFSLKGSTAGALAVPSRVFSRKIMTGDA